MKVPGPNGTEIDVPAGITKFERTKNGEAVYGSLNDPRMGVNDFQRRCKTCDCNYGSGSKMDDCPGHFGHIQLCRPVYHCGFIDEVLRILRCVCFGCSRLLLDEHSPKDKDLLKIKDPEIRFRYIHSRCNRTKVVCENSTNDEAKKFFEISSAVGAIIGEGNGETNGETNFVQEDDYRSNDASKKIATSLKPPCSKVQPKFQREGMTLYATYPPDVFAGKQGREELSARDVFDVFRNISHDDIRKLGFDPTLAHPAWMLVSVLPVPPPHVRPTVVQDNMDSPDDLTQQLTAILKSNAALQNATDRGENGTVVRELEKLLQTHVTAFFDNERDDTTRATQKTGRPLKTIRSRLKGKEGRLRGNLMGKRVDFSARTVITADPNLSIHQVGVPKSVASTLTVPITVTPFNIEEMKELVTRGPDRWPGACYIVRSDGSRIDLRYRSGGEINLEFGWIVERHLRDDDVVLFNRQPSLHKMSIMGHRAKVLDWSTFRLNLSVTTPYNADFDGDEMNLHVPQSITAQADADELMMVPRNIVTPQNNRNVMGIVQDALLGVTRMTKRDVFIEKDVFMNAMMWIPDWDGLLPSPAIIKPRPLWTGKQLLSMILPNINYKGRAKNHVDDKKTKGTPVEVNVKGRGRWIRARIVVVHSIYTVEYDDGTEEKEIKDDMIRPDSSLAPNTALAKGVRVEVNQHEKGRWVRGKITSVGGNDTFAVQYDNGEKESHIKGDLLRLDTFNYLDSEVLITSTKDGRGVLLQGIVDKNIVGTSGGSVVHVCWLQEGWERTRNFMNQVQAIVNYWMVNTSYSVGVCDTVADAETINNIQKALDEARNKVNKIMSDAQSAKLKLMPGKPLMESFEMNMNEVLNEARSSVGKSAQKSLKERNAIKGTVMAGSKGSELNISQIIACVGQQNVQGKRIRYGFNQRTLPHFAKDDLGMESRGFVENSYLRGLTPQEFFFHAMGGREGCIDTAVKTSETGYIQRRLVKAMETVMARYDTTLRNARGCVMQFLYGEDGMDAQKIEKQVFDSYKLTANKFRDMYYLDTTAGNLGQLGYINSKTKTNALFMTPKVIEHARHDSDLRDLLNAEYQQLLQDRAELRVIMAVAKGATSVDDPNVNLPVNIDRIVWTAQRQFNINMSEPSSLQPLYVVNKVKELCEKELIVVRGDDRISKEAQENATLLFKMLVRSKLATKRVLRDYRLTLESFDWVIKSIAFTFKSSIVHPGEMAGVVAAQSIGEPATQMTLNTFHNTGISAKNVTLGVPRLNELLNVGKNIKTPSCIINLQDHLKMSQETASLVMNKLEYVRLGDISIRAEIHYDPDPMTTVVDDDREFVEFQTSFGDVDDSSGRRPMSRWVLRIVLDEKFIQPRIQAETCSMADIANKIKQQFVVDDGEGAVQEGLHIMYSDDNSQEYVIRIRLIVEEDDEDGMRQEDSEDAEADLEMLMQIQAKILNGLHLFGVPGITKVYLSEKKLQVWDDNEGFKTHVEYALETDGSNLAEVMTFPDVDHTTTVSNDIVEVFNVLGIEAARGSLFNELRNVLSFDNAYVNYRHIACLADCMTYGGYLMAVSRHGINNGETGPLLRASFEETVEVFMNSAAFSHYDILNGVTENVMLGQLARVGSGLVDLLLDHRKLQSATDMLQSEVGVTDRFDNYDKIGSITPSMSTTPSITPIANYASMTPMLGSFTPMLGSFTPSGMVGNMSPMGGYQSPYFATSGAMTPGRAVTSSYARYFFIDYFVLLF